MSESETHGEKREKLGSVVCVCVCERERERERERGGNSWGVWQ